MEAPKSPISPFEESVRSVTDFVQLYRVLKSFEPEITRYIQQHPGEIGASFDDLYDTIVSIPKELLGKAKPDSKVLEDAMNGIPKVFGLQETVSRLLIEAPWGPNK